MDKEIFKNHTDYWQVADNIRDIYLSDGSLTTLLDFERVLDEVWTGVLSTAQMQTEYNAYKARFGY